MKQEKNGKTGRKKQKSGQNQSFFLRARTSKILSFAFDLEKDALSKFGNSKIETAKKTG